MRGKMEARHQGHMQVPVSSQEEHFTHDHFSNAREFRV